MEKQGVIYILTNPSFPEYVKIGYADDIDKRLQQLNRSECIPFAFRVYATYEVNSRLSDLKIHSIIDKLNPNLRSIENFNGHKRVREFYAMSAEDAYSILEAIAEIHGCSDKLKLATMSEDDKAADEFKDGLCLIFRLSVDDYHRYCYVDSGYKSDNHYIKGVLHTVQPVAVVGEKALVKNSREYTFLFTDNFGKIVQVEIGALLVGRIKNHHGAQEIIKGQEKGFFEYGGSTIVLLLKKEFFI